MDTADRLAQEAPLDRKAGDQVVDLEDRRLIAFDGVLGRLDRLDLAGLHVDLREPQRTILAGHRAKLRHGRQKRTGIGMFCAGKEIVRRAGLDLLAAIHDDGAVGNFRDHAHVMGDEEDRHALLFLQRLDQLKNLRLDGDVERGCRLVRDQQLGITGKRDGDDDALAHAARKVHRIFVEARLGRGNPNLFEKPYGFSLSLAFRHAAMLTQHFGDLLTDLQDRVERGHRFLKDHADTVAANFLHVLERDGQKFLALEFNLAGHAGVSGRQQAHDRHGRDAFAGAGFADDGNGFLRCDVEAHIFDDIAPLAADAESRVEVGDGENRIGHDLSPRDAD
ncbi:hypothetical protein D3C73_610300 [compost metagenome]